LLAIVIPFIRLSLSKPFSSQNYFLGEQFPLPPPDGLPVVDGPFGGLHPDLAIVVFLSLLNFLTSFG